MSPTSRLLPLLHLLLHLLLLLLRPEDTRSESTRPEKHTGKEFLVAFPEIIAYFHPDKPSISIQAMALFNETSVTVFSNFDEKSKTQTLEKTYDFTFDENLELGKEEISNKSVRITSTRNISVFATSQKNNSIQSVLIVPADKLGTKYFIPTVPSIEATTNPESGVTMQVTERSPFRIIILNAGADNKVTVKGEKDKVIKLSPYQVAQVWLEQEKQMQAVEAEAPVAVFFGHPCALRKSCTCGQLYTTVPLAKDDTPDFFIPPFLVQSGSDEAMVLVLDGSGESSSRRYSADSPVVKQASAAILYSPGLLLTLTPESDFASCYLVSTIPDVTSYVVIMVKKDQIDGVHVGTTKVEKGWESVKNTDYKAVRHDLQEGRSVIWHAYSKMAVYFIGENDGNQFGHPAPIVSTTPDFRGCAVVPDVLYVGDSAKGWRESLKFCSDENMELISFPKEVHLNQVNRELAQREPWDVTGLWIGMRRSSLTGEWYWANNVTVDITNWDEDEPGSVEDGQCAIMSTKKDHDFMWRDEDCCMRARPLCFGRGKVITE